VALRGPRGEQVLKPDLAEPLVRSLAAHRYSYPEPANKNLVEITPEPSGMPIGLDLSAMGWARVMNTTQTILAPVYLATPSSQKRFLRAVTPGTELELAGPGGMYAVLLYAGTLSKNLPPPGVPSAPGVPGAPAPKPPLQQAEEELPVELRAAFQDLLANGKDPLSMERLADELEKEGFSKSAALLRRRAADLRAAYASSAPSAPTPVPAPVPAPPAPLPVPVPIPEPVPSGAVMQTGTVRAPSGLLLRSGPSTSAPQIVLMPFGSSILFEPSGTPGWASVLYAGRRGYASLEWITPTGVGPAPAPPSSETIAYVKAPSGLMLRSGPGSSNPPVMASAMPYGSQVTLLGGSAPGTPGGWAKVSYAGKEGYASTDWLSSAPAGALQATPYGSPSSAPSPTGVYAIRPGGSATVTAPSGLNLRASAPSGTVLALMPKGSVVRIIEVGPTSATPQGWVRATYAGKTGFASAEWLRGEAV
jgi:uncharacterized protein YraI